MPDLLAPPFVAFGPDDLDRAHAGWGCNCGPAALAACFGMPLDAVRPHLGDFERRGYVNPTMMAAAVEAAGFRRRESVGWPAHGLARIQWHGPWTAPGASPRWASCHTHWVASKAKGGGAWIFDVNAGWRTLPDWEAETVPRIVAAIARADGRWSLTHSWEVRRAR